MGIGCPAKRCTRSAGLSAAPAALTRKAPTNGDVRALPRRNGTGRGGRLHESRDAPRGAGMPKRPPLSAVCPSLWTRCRGTLPHADAVAAVGPFACGLSGQLNHITFSAGHAGTFFGPPIFARKAHLRRRRKRPFFRFGLYCYFFIAFRFCIIIKTGAGATRADRKTRFERYFPP